MDARQFPLAWPTAMLLNRVMRNHESRTDHAYAELELFWTERARLYMRTKRL